MTPEADLDVVIVTYNSADHIADAIGRLPACASVIVVDNASTDGSADVARALGVEVIESDANSGFGASANRGARRGSAEHILFLNPDAVIEPDDLHRLVDELRTEPEVAVASPVLRNPDGSTQRASWPYPSATRSWLEALGVIRWGGPEVEQFVIGAAFLVRRSVFEDLDGFDERFWLYAEETDLCRRALDAGWSVRLVEDASATHIGGASGATEPGLVFDHFNRGLEHYVLKRGGVGALVSARTALAVGSAIRIAVPGSSARRQLHRSRLARLSQVALRSPVSVPLDSPATRAPGKGVVVCSLEPWDDVWRRNQFFVRELLAIDPNRRILFVEPPFDWVHEARRRSGRRRRRGLRPLPQDGRVALLEPGKVWPRAAGSFADRSLRRQVRRAVGELGFARPTLWVNDPAYARLPTESGWPSVYDITDDWTEAGPDGGAGGRVRHNESILFGECNAVVVCSEGLAATRRPERPDLVVIPNGADTAHLVEPQPRPADLPAGAVAVYVGTLHDERVDVPLVLELAARLPQLQIVLVGPDALTDRSRADLDTAGVRRLGPRPYAQVPGYLQHADVLIVPHVVSAFTESLDPIKAHECLAVGRPTVATPVAGFRDLGDPIRVAARDDFVATVEHVLAEAPASRPQPVASWADRTVGFAAVLDAARDTPSARLRVLRVYHSAVVSSWRRRDHELRARGVDVATVAARAWNEGGRTVQLDPDPGEAVIAARTFGHHPYLFAYDPRPIWRELRRRAIDVLDIHEEPASLAAAEVQLLAAVAGRRVPFSLYSAQNIEKRYPVPFRWFERIALRRAAAIHTCNDAAAGILRRKGFRGAIENLGLGVDVERFAPTTSPRPDGPLRVGYVGRLEAHKGVGTLIDAVASTDDTTLTIVGDGPERDTLVRQIRDLDLGDRVVVEGYRSASELPEQLHRFDVLVVPSLETPSWIEQFGRVAVEGMATGLPVIASDSGSLPEVVGDAGLLVEPGSVTEIVGAITQLRDPARRNELGRRALDRAQHYSWSEIAARQQGLYDTMVAPAGRRRLRVVYVDHCAELSGGEHALARLLPALGDVDAHVILGEDGPLVERLRDLQISVEVLALDPDVAHTHRDEVVRGGLGAQRAAKTARSTAQLARRLRELRPDVVHTNSLKAALYGGAAARAARIPTVWHIRDRISDDYLPAQTAAVIRRLAKVVPNAVIANSESTLETLGPIANTSVIPSPLDPAFLAIEARTSERADTLRVAMVGRLAPWKGQDVFLRAFAKALPDDAEAVLVGTAMFGEDDYARSLELLVAELGIERRVTFAGFVDDVASLLGGCDVLVHASTIPEPFGQVVVEGMAAGLVVIAADAGGPAEVVTDGVDGLLYPPGDVDALADRLARAASDLRSDQALRANARRRALDFAAPVVARSVMAVYESVARSHPTGSAGSSS